MKCLAMELESVHVRAVDVNPEDPVAKTAERLFQELGDVSGPSEIGHFAGRRVTWSPIAAPLDKSIGTRLDITERDTILITGGARGITAAVARRLAEMCQPRLILVGRSPLPTAAELADTANLIEPAAIKAALIERARQSGHTVQPAAIESEYQRLMREREVRNTLMSLRCTGATVEYHQIDVTDADAMAGLLEMIDSHYGGLQGIIHGAGIIDDKLVRDKTPESLERVFRTKVESAAILARLVRPESLKFCVFFSSIASRYGNRGQADYAAANEVLSKLAWELDRVWPARVCAIAWGPWAEIGMVADLERHLTARGVSLIAPEVGVRFLLEELFYGAKGESEVLIAGGAEHLVKATESAVL
jgi:NAD(P)-dependent dehydrogenase (short-subunit alcohol dehydrogenase family)